jgi:hypothetical protein
MKTFTCSCGRLIFFQNISCLACNRELGFLPDSLTLSVIEPTGDGFFFAKRRGGPSRRYKKCQNYAQQSVCNWMIPEEERNEAFCQSCRLNQVIPDLDSGQNRALWALTELAKRRLIYSLLNLKLPVSDKARDSEKGLAFRFLSDVVNPDGSVSKILTGHDNRTITLNIAEADDGFREKVRLAMNEPYRTLLGHFRHEIGHYYWDRLVRGTQILDPYRALFGDERADYATALQTYYVNGAPANWQANHVSAYATAHPWEDWAETWAHFMHIQDTLEVATDFGLQGKRAHRDSNWPEAESAHTLKHDKFDQMIEAWMSLVVALNSINRSMGHQDLYPFVLSPAVIDKLRFVSEVISGSHVSQSAEPGAAS